MYGRIKVSLVNIALCLTELTDLVNAALSNHHKKVAYIAYRIAETLGYPLPALMDITLAGLLHDIGAFSLEERRAILAGEGPDAFSHAFKGAKLLEGFHHLNNASYIIKYHHLNWENGKGQYFNGEKVDERSHILHLADRIAISIGNHEHVLNQAKRIEKKMSDFKDTYFKPAHIDAFSTLAKQEQFWLDIVYEPLLDILPEMLASPEMILDLDEQISIAKLFANVIDFRSPITANHSRGVAASAEHLARLMNFSPMECQMMLIAGYLHDLGKIAVPSEILEKPAKLDVKEFSVMRSHTYYTYRVLNKIKALQPITEWAAFHHERLDGTGYPFRLKDVELSLGARIMAVADVFTAVSEDRPYRHGMEKEKVINVLISMSKNNALCPNVTTVMLDNFDDINETRINAQIKSQEDYESVIA